MISIEINEYSYKPKQPVLQNIQITLERGGITSVLGPSGCGKSTLLRVLMGFEKPAQGQIQVDSKQHSLQKWDETQNVFSLVPQTPYLFPWKTIFENIALGISDNVRSLNNTEIADRISKILAVVGLAGIENKYPFEISVGMSQRVSFARAMINSFQALLLDEPFSSLDAITRHELQNWLLEMVTREKSYGLFVTHDISEAIHISKNIYILSKSPARIVAHFSKNSSDDSFVNKLTGKIFKHGEMRELELEIFNFLA